VDDVKHNISNDLKSLEFEQDAIIKVFLIIDNLSFSKEKKLRTQGKSILHEFENYPELLTTMRNIVSDADKIEAVSEMAIDRMVQYGHHQDSTWNLKDHVQHIQQHCMEKLFLLVKDKYIRTQIGQKIATNCINKLRELVEDNNKLTDYVKTCLEKLNK